MYEILNPTRGSQVALLQHYMYMGQADKEENEYNEFIQVIKSSWGFVCLAQRPLFSFFLPFFSFHAAIVTDCQNMIWGGHTHPWCVCQVTHHLPTTVVVYDSSLTMSTIVLSQQWARKQPSRHAQYHSRSKTTCLPACARGVLIGDLNPWLHDLRYKPA